MKLQKKMFYNMGASLQNEQKQGIRQEYRTLQHLSDND